MRLWSAEGFKLSFQENFMGFAGVENFQALHFTASTETFKES